MASRRGLVIGSTILTLLGALSVGQLLLEQRVAARGQDSVQTPRFAVDPLWPKPLPNKWVMGSVIGVSVDSMDQIWMIHRPSSLSDNEKAAALDPPWAACCVPAPPVLAFDQEGNLVDSWGGPGAGYQWPQSEHGLYVDYKDNVWVGGNGRNDHQIVKFTRDGRFLLQIGRSGMSQGSNDTENLKQPTTMTVDPVANEVYVADGYGNRRVIVFDADTGEYKRHWGAYGNRPDDADTYNASGATVGPDYDADKPPSTQFSRAVHGVAISEDRLVYVADRVNNRLQVFEPNGTFVREAFVDRRTRGFGSVFELAFSKDSDQRFLYNPNGMNQSVDILLRDSLEVVARFGQGGRYPGQFYSVHSITVDSRGNIYTGETLEGKRLQRFVYQGM
jgi:DNA-binding beta-propeller fold protein YncE